MFRKIFGTNNNNGVNKRRQIEKKPDNLFTMALAERKKEDPLAGVKLGAIEVNQRLMKALNRSGQGIHVESLLTAIAALAGFSCQMAIREEVIGTGALSEHEIFAVVEVNNGARFFTGEALNKPLVEGHLSICCMVADAVRQSAVEPPSINESITYSISTLGTDKFAVPRVDQDKYASHTPPQDLVRELWPFILPVVDKFCESPSERPVLFAMGLHRLIAQSKQIVPPVIAATIVMDVALAMSKIDPAPLWVESANETRKA